MQQFLIIAAAHFLALLSPGPDFFLIARTSVAAGWRVASGACLGVALANGAFIVAAFSGVSMFRPDSPIFIAFQIVGCLYLLYLGAIFIRYSGRPTQLAAQNGVVQEATSSASSAWLRAAGMGFLSGILNPKNALFYVSLAAMLTGPYAGSTWKLFYGLWMFSVVLLWDLVVAAMMGNEAMLQRFSGALPWLERASGAVLIVLALGVLVTLLNKG